MPAPSSYTHAFQPRVAVQEEADPRVSFQETAFQEAGETGAFQGALDIAFQHTAFQETAFQRFMTDVAFAQLAFQGDAFERGTRPAAATADVLPHELMVLQAVNRSSVY